MSTPRPQVAAARARHVRVTPELLTIEWEDGASAEFASLWLRDNRPADRDARSGQRLTDIADLPERPRIRSAAAQGSVLQVLWEDAAAPTDFDLAWLQSRVRAADGPPERRVTAWNGGDLDAARDFARLSYAELRDDPRRRLDWLTRLLQSGLAFMTGLPGTDGAIVAAASLVGRICETNYGAVFDVRSVPTPENLAYTDLGLGLHTDNPYRDPVPGFQALHALAAAASGGESLFADGFALAAHLRRADPEAFDTLTRTPVPFHYRSQDAELYAERPLIQLSPSGQVLAVHYNSRGIAPLPDHGGGGTTFYRAYRRFAALLREPAHQLRWRLRDGELVLFDNHRILHGRTAFSSARSARHLRGCYLSRDSVYSSAALLRRRITEGATP